VSTAHENPFLKREKKNKNLAQHKNKQTNKLGQKKMVTQTFPVTLRKNPVKENQYFVIKP
jgi:hypothetical protein